jgi:hypothetical protein
MLAIDNIQTAVFESHIDQRKQMSHNKGIEK